MASDSSNSVRKVVIHLRATGDAPILKQAKFKVCDTGAEVCLLNCLDSHCDQLYMVVGFSSRISGTDKFAKVIDFLRHQLHKETLFVYVNSAFSPNPDQLVIDLYDNFGFDGKLVVNYACSMAWG